MPQLSSEQLSLLVDESKELWLWMEEYRVGHQESYRKESKTTDQLKLTAVGASFVTIISTAPGLSDVAFLTTGAAIITACVTSLNQILSPEKKQRTHWDIIKKIEINQKELTSKTRGFFYSSNFDKELFYLQRLQQSINQFLSSDIDINEMHKKKAKEELARVRFEPSAQPEAPAAPDIDDSDEGMLEEAAAGIAEAVRVRRGGMQ